MAPQWVGPVVKCILLLIGCVLLIATAAGTSAVVQSSGDVKFSKDEGGIGIFKMKQGGVTSDPVDLFDLYCDNFSAMWKGMRACVLFGVLGCGFSILVTLTFLKSTTENTIRNVCAIIWDLLAVLGSVVLVILILVIWFSKPCKNWVSYADRPGVALGYGIYTTSVALVLILISVCVGMGTKPKQQAQGQSQDADYQRQMNRM